MDERLEKALQFSNYQKTIQTQKDNLKLSLEHKLLVKIENNIFKCSMDLINFIQTCILNDYDHTIILDCSNNPVKVKHLENILKLFLDVYYSSYEEYVSKYENLKKARNIKKVIS